MQSDTAPIRPEERFDEERVADYLRRHVPHLGGGPITFEQFPGGRANLTYLARSGDAEVVLRRPPLGPVAPGSHDMSREHQVLSVLHTVYPPAPRSYHLCDDPSVMGKPFLVMERRTGWVVRDTWPPELPGDDEFPATVARSVVDALADLHGVDFTAIGLGGLGRPDGFLERQVVGWADRWARARHDPVPLMDRLGDRYAAAIPEPRAAVLLHNDFKLDNVMISTAGDVVAVLDWDMATLGDPLLDLGAALAYWGQEGDPASGVFGVGSARVSAAMTHHEVVERYARRTGFGISEIAFYHSFAVYRLAVIVQQIYVRFVRGQTSDERFAGLGALVPLLADHAAALLAGA